MKKSTNYRLTGILPIYPHNTGHEDFGYYVDVSAIEVSDGYHTMSELYDHRLALNVALFNIVARDGADVVKSKLHSDGTMFEGGYFIVVWNVNKGMQISYHYKLEHWEKFQINEVELAPTYDGHTPQDVIKRLLKL